MTGRTTLQRTSWFGSSHTASIVVVLLVTFGRLVISSALILVFSVRTVSHPALTLKLGEKTNLALDTESNCDFHVFFSHVWKTGQGKSHAIVRKM